MPFVEQSHRDKPDLTIPGDRCYVYYKQMIDQWKANPRWTTIDKMMDNILPDDNARAYFLAFLVFFLKEGMRYEEVKEALNGPIK